MILNLTKDELKAALFAVRADLETVTQDVSEWPEVEIEAIKSLLDKLEAVS